MIAGTLKKWIEDGTFHLSAPSKSLPTETIFKPAKQTREVNFVGGITQKAVTCREDEEITAVAQRIVGRSVNHIVAVDKNGKLRGIVTSWDITKAVAEDKKKLKDIVVRRVITTTVNEPIEAASRKMAQNKISALPVIDGERKVVGIVTSEDISRLIGGRGTW